MDKNQLYLLIAVFAILMVILVWLGAKMFFTIRNSKSKREKRRKEWKKKFEK